MILRLVYSFFFFSLAAGNHLLQDSSKTDRTGDCQNKICVCQDQLDSGLPQTSPLNLVHSQVVTKITELPPKVAEGHYGYPAHSLISSNPVHSMSPQARIDSKSFDVEFLSEETPSVQVPRPIQYVEAEREYKEKTICFTPTMVHKMIKAALEYVSHMPSDINNVIDKLDQELDRMSEQETIEENADKKSLYPLDSKTIFKMVDKPRSKTRTNLVLKYELPTVKEPHCREALEKLIEIAYTAYMELEQHPQCREYLYNFAAHQPEDRPTGHFDQGPDLKSMIASILDQVDKHKPNLNITPESDRYGDMEIPIPEIPASQIHEYNIPQRPHFHEYNIHKYSVEEVPESYNVPQVKQYNINEYNLPQVNELIQPELNLPKGHENSINEYSVPQTQELTKPELNLPSIHEYNINEYNVPQVHEYSITKTHEYNVPTVHEYTITQSHEFNIPQIEMPEIHKTIHETIQETIPMQPEETINILIKLLQKNDHPDSGNLFDRLMNILQENQDNFHPRLHKHLITLLNSHKRNNIPRFNDIFLLLLDSQRNRDWPWSDRVTEHLLSYLLPDHTGNLDSRIVDIILNLYKQQPNEKHTEYILSLLRPFKDENLDVNIRDTILKLIHLHQNNLMRPEFVDILLKLLKSSSNGNGSPIAVDLADNLSRWNEMGISPNQLNGLFELLKPFVNGHSDHRPLDIVYFMLTQNRHLNPKHLDFILSFLYPENGILDSRRIDIIHFLLKNVTRYPKHVNILLNLLQDNTPGVLNSRFMEILLFLNSHKLLNPELVENIINLLANEVTGQLEDDQVKTLFFQLAPFKQANPKLVVDVLSLLNQGGLHGNIVEWLKNTNNNIGLPKRDSTPANLKIVFEEVKQDSNNEYRTPDGGYQIQDGTQQNPDHDFMSIFKWLDSQGLLTKDQGSNTDLVNKILKILEVGQRELGVVELTYMLKHEKPLIYQPVYYVKYRLPIISFISNMKTLLQENPNLNTEPMKLLQELIVISNVTEVSPNLQGFPKEEILKLTFNDGDLVQAKILDEQNLSLNDQITYVHGLNSDISPEEILQLNKMNEAKYFPNFLEVKGLHPEQLTSKDVVKFIDVPPVHYRHIDINPAEVTHQTKTIHQQQYIVRENQNQDGLHNNNAQLRK